MKVNKLQSKKNSTVYVITLQRSGSDETSVCGVAYDYEKAKSIAKLFEAPYYTDIYEIEPNWYDEFIKGNCKVFYCSYLKSTKKLDISETSVGENFGNPYDKICETFDTRYYMYTFAANFGEAESNFYKQLKIYKEEQEKKRKEEEKKGW